ncbi:hypothetical protein ACKU27_23525 [Sphingobium yanoikuyae]|uniref:hypothetical protein n=1 Tax=Sphingobium yanoikuyae TaxID=13690 RepID=UPI003B9102C0
MKLEQGSVATPYSFDASVYQQFQAISTLDVGFASLETRVVSAEGSITTLQSSMTSTNGSISTLQTNVSSLSGAVSTLQSSSTTQAGQISTLQSTVASQGATISSNSQAITTMQGSLATLSNVVNASSSPNLIPGIEIGLTGWYGDGFSRTISGGWGMIAYRNSPFTGLAFLDSPIVPAFQFKAYTAAADSSLFTTGMGSTRVEILFKDGAGNIIGNPQSQSRYAAPNADFVDDGSSRATLTASGYAPAGTVSVQVRLTAQLDSGSLSAIGWRQVKLEQGTVATPYSGEASAVQTFQAFSDLNGSVATLSSTVSAQGAQVSNLQTAYSGLNGTVASLQSTVSAHGASISSLQSVQSTHAGQIATLNTQIVSGGGNLLQNTDFAIGTTGWSFNQQGTAHSGGRDLLGDNYRPLNEHNIAIYHSNNNGADYAYWAADRVAIVPGKIYEFSAGIANNRANCALYLRYVYGDGSIAQDFTVAKNYFSEGRLLENFPTFFVRGQAPAGAWWVECLLLKSGTSPGYADSYAWFVRPQLVEVPTVSGGPAAYSPGATGAVVSQQAQAISSATGQLSTLSSTVSAQGAQVSNLQSAYSGLNGTVASLQSTVSANSASISTLQSATSTLQGNVATLTTRVSASGGNLLPNGGLENGFDTGVSDPGGFNFVAGGWGPIAETTANGLHIFYFSPVENPQIGAQYTVAMDPLNFGASDIYCNIVCVDSAGNVLLDGTPGTQISGGDFSNNDDRRARSACTVTVPSNTARLIVRAYGTVRDGQPIGFRRVKLERSNTWSPYTVEASIAQQFQTLSTLSTQYASLSSTVSTQGVTISTQATAISTLQSNVTSLFAKWSLELDVNGYVSGMVTNNNGTRADLTLRMDKVKMVTPSGLGGYWQVIFDGQGRPTQTIGDDASGVMIEIGYLA